jgi:hypothetical protein
VIKKSGAAKGAAASPTGSSSKIDGGDDVEDAIQHIRGDWRHIDQELVEVVFLLGFIASDPASVEARDGGLDKAYGYCCATAAM